MAVRKDQVRIAVVVEVKEAQAPAAVQPGLPAHFERGVDEIVALEVLVQAEHLLVDVRHEQVLPAVAVVVRRVDPHAGSRRAGVAVGHSQQQAFFVEGSVALVDKEKVLNRVVGDEQVQRAVAVDVCRHGAE